MSPGLTHGPFDVAVIGGGIVGVAGAAHLAAAGRRVVLVERAELGAGASGRNSGVVQHPFDPVLVDLHLETVDLYRALEGVDLPAAPAGLLSVTHDVEGVARLARQLAVTHPHLRPTFIPPGESRRIEPSLAPGVAACRLDIGYPVGPAAATRAYGDQARRLGVEVRLGLGARPWMDRGHAAGITLDDGTRIAVGDVVVAAGPWSPALVDPSGAWRPIRPVWGVVVPVALDPPPAHVLEEAEISIEPGAAEASDEAGLAFSLVTAAGVSSLGSTFLAEEPDPAALVPSIVARGARFVPAVSQASRGAVRVCARPASLDGRPLIGQVPGIDGLWIASGHGPWGISTGPACGRLFADLVAGRWAAPPAALDPARFGRPTVQASEP
jgi:glycine/D-amino acid oxidase-like deaminating enzyme